MRNRFRSSFNTIAALASLLPGLAAGQTVLDDSFPADLPVSFAQLHQQLTSRFYDPPSTRYRRFVVVDRLVADYVICGWLSSRNSRGVYTSFYPFAYRVRTGAAFLAVTYLQPSRSAAARATLAEFGCTSEVLGGAP